MFKSKKQKKPHSCLSWLERHPIHQKVASLIPGWGVCRRQLINAMFFLFLFLTPLSSFLKSVKKEEKKTHNKIPLHTL